MSETPTDGQSDALPLVSVVCVSYARPELLSRTVRSLLERTKGVRTELILADDGSPDELRGAINALPFDVWIWGPHGGMGANTNRGLRAARGDYILQLQDDWECIASADFLREAVRVLDQWPDVDLVRFYGTEVLPIHEPRVAIGIDCRCLVYPGKQPNGAYQYSDTPHLKRRRFHEDIGWYREGVAMQKSELDLCRRLDRCPGRYVATLPGAEVAFLHIGSAHSHRRATARETLGRWIRKIPFVGRAIERIRRAM